MIKQAVFRVLTLVLLTVLILMLTVKDNLKDTHFFWANSPNATLITSTFWEDISKCQENRLKRLHSKCREMNMTSDIFAVDDVIKLQHILGITLTESYHHIIFSAIKKTGCSSWKSLLIANAANFSDEPLKQIGTKNYNAMCQYRGICILSNLKKSEIMYRLRKYHKIITVRHPLSRLESAFKDKFLDLDRITGNVSIEIDKEIVQTFQDFLDHISDYLTNRHYMPFTENSNPCLIPFDYIAKLETGTFEMEYISKNYLSGLYTTTHIHPTKNMAGESERLRNGDKRLALFSALADPAKSIEKLMKHYGADMTLFGYKYNIRNGKVYAECDSYDLNGMCC